jgi:holo-[acyl-carrier protein] synthase
MTILGVGLEIIDKSQWDRKLQKSGENFFEKFFTSNERRYCEEKRNPSIHYSARWACKIAVLQALGLLRSRESLMKGVEIKLDSGGKPRVHLDLKIALKRKDWKIRQIKVSLSHSDCYSAAEAIVLGKEQ